MSDREAVNLAIGRILRISSRPAQPGDVAEYERCRGIVLDLVPASEAHPSSAPLPGWNFGSGNNGVIE